MVAHEIRIGKLPDQLRTPCLQLNDSVRRRILLKFRTRYLDIFIIWGHLMSFEGHKVRM